MAVKYGIPVKGLVFHANNAVVGFIAVAKPVGHDEV